MNYPYPYQKDLYRYINEKKSFRGVETLLAEKKFSRKEESLLMKHYQSFIAHKSKFLRHVPFVSQIYLCNSISFNGLREGSDIDIVIVSHPGFLWLARLRSRIFFFFLGFKRKKRGSHHSYKFCLSFYIDGTDLQLSSLRRNNGDVYLSYWLAHCVLLYTDHYFPDDKIFRSNKELLDYLPYHPHTQTIFLNIPVIRGSSFFKYTVEWIFATKLGIFFQKIIQKIRGGRINRWKRSQLASYEQQHIIISPAMLKFYSDQRIFYQQRRKQAIRKGSISG